MEQKSWFVAERAKALATIYITERGDLSLIAQPERDDGLDYVVEIKSPRNHGYRKFGFFLYGSMGHLTKADVDKSMTLKLKRWHREKVFPYPVALFDFSVTDDSGFYTWLAEPVIEEGSPRLRHLKEAHSEPLDRESLDRIVSSVDSWYDTFYATLIVSD